MKARAGPELGGFKVELSLVTDSWPIPSMSADIT